MNLKNEKVIFNMILYCDIDGTINDFQNRWNKYGKNSLKKEALMKDNVLPLSVETLNRFRRLGWSVYFLTARGNIPERITISWLTEKGFVFNGLCQVNKMEDKIEFLKLHDFDLFIDDFMSGQDTNKPIFVSHVYDAIRKLGQVEVFRNNWKEISERYLT